MKNKRLIIAIGLIALICCCGVVCAAQTIDLGKITSSEFSASQLYSGAGNSFTINDDGTISPNGNSELDLDYDFSINIDASDISGDVKDTLDESVDLICNFTISDGSSYYTFENVDCNAEFEDNTLIITGNEMVYDLSGMNVDINNCEIVNCTIVCDEYGEVGSYQASK